MKNQDLTKLQKRVERMLDGEKKRREVALRFADKIYEIIVPVAGEIWGNGDGGIEMPGMVFVRNAKNQETALYFRYISWDGCNDRYESGGFYCNEKSSVPEVWGEAISQLRGSDFWWAIRTIVEWIPRVIELMEKKETSRQKLLGLLAQTKQENRK